MQAGKEQVAGPPHERGQTGHHMEQTQDSSVNGLNERVHEAGGEGRLGCHWTSRARRTLFQEPEWNKNIFI